ncbi:TBC1 domain family member 31-like [Ctenocephalides felis]|nr:TBC1 domain family member 31-like [Ctenocephalides felis]
MNSLNAFQQDDVVQKQDFQYKKRTENGMLLEIHHTVVGETGDIRRIKFFLVAFDYDEERLAACDRKGNIFVIDLKASQLWTLPTTGKVTALAYACHVKNLILTASKDGLIHVRDIDNGSVIEVMEGHKDKVMSFSFDMEYFCLSASTSEAFVWDLQTYGIVHKVNLKSNANIVQAMFIPIRHDLVALFSDDVLHVWNHDTFEPRKKITSFSTKFANANSLASSKDGRTLIISGAGDYIALYDTETWQPLKQICLNNVEIVQIMFIPQTFDLGASKILAVLTSDSTLHVVNTESSMLLQKVSTKDAVKFLCSENGKYLCCLSRMGEVHVYNVKQMFGKYKGEPISLPSENSLKFVRSCESFRRLENQGDDNGVSAMASRKANRLRLIQDELKKTLSIKKLRPILLQYQEYPDKHRNLIWRFLLKLPNNFTVYKSLADRGLHNSFKNLEQTHPMKSVRTMRNMKTVLSILAHWCPLFAQVEYLPSLIFPFVKIFENNSLVTFEAIYTILVNYCQFWFEYHPLPPANILLIVENVIGEHCEMLINYYDDLQITPQEYAWPILSTGFSEILDTNQWCSLWDNILTNDTCFLLLAVAAYNIVQKNVIVQHKTKQDCCDFFRTQNHFDMSLFIKLIYELDKSTSDDNHPKYF